jgi:hypothetical protein
VRAALGLAVALLLWGCTTSEQVTGGQTPPSSSDPHGALACDDETRSGIDDAIGGQLDALAVGDYDAALGYASDSFRAGNSPEQFQATIEEEYPLLLSAEGHTSSTCVRQGDVAELLVTVEVQGDRTDELIYRVVLQEERWRIASAGHARAEPSPSPIPV